MPNGVISIRLKVLEYLLYGRSCSQWGPPVHVHLLKNRFAGHTVLAEFLSVSMQTVPLASRASSSSVETVSLLLPLKTSHRLSPDGLRLSVLGGSLFGNLDDSHQIGEGFSGRV